MEQSLDKKNRFKLILILLIIILLIVFIWYFFTKQGNQVKTKESTREDEIRQQLEELNAMGPAKLSEEEIQKQLGDLNNTKPTEEIKPLSEEEILKQLEELNKLQSN